MWPPDFRLPSERRGRIRPTCPRDRPKWHAESRITTDPKEKEPEMPKMKTKSSCKKRFKFTASGKVKCGQAGKRHGMIKRTNKFIRDARGTTVMSEADAKIVRPMMPYSR
jgi:large subunit ribosomal protein L35